MFKKALRDLIGLVENKGANGKRPARIPFRSRLSLEPLEARRLLAVAAFDLSGYEEHNPVTTLPGTGGDFSGVAYHEPSQSFLSSTTSKTQTMAISTSTNT